MSLGSGELLIILVILLVLFGAGQLPKLARSIGQAARELRRAEESDEPDGPASTET